MNRHSIRRLAIRDLHAAGWSDDSIASALGITARQVRNHRVQLAEARDKGLRELREYQQLTAELEMAG